MRVALLALLCGLGAFGALAQSDDPDDDAQEPAESDAYKPAPSQHEGAAPRKLHVEAPEGARVLRVPIEGTIDLGISAFVQRALDVDDDVALVVLDINTLGGRVDAAIQVRDALLQSRVPTVAYVHPRAISAGALISLACDFIAVAPGATIGAATPIQMGQGGAQPVEEKMVSYFRTEMRATAEAKGRRGDIAEAMVDASVEIEGLSQAGKLLTLDTEAALKWGMADLQAKSLPMVLKQLGLDHPTVQDSDENWAEDVVRFLTDPVVSGLLMSLGTLGLLMELYSPGLGLPGIVGATCILLFFGGHLLVNLAGIEELMLFVVGALLLLLEVFVIPGFGVAGILGTLSILVSLVMTLVGLPLGVTFSTGAWIEPLQRVMLALLTTFVGALIAARYLPRTTAGRRLILSHATDQAAGFVSNKDERALVGVVGVAASDLRPSGIAMIEGRRVDVVTRGDYLAAGTSLRVLEVEGARVVVSAEPEEQASES